MSISLPLYAADPAQRTWAGVGPYPPLMPISAYKLLHSSLCSVVKKKTLKWHDPAFRACAGAVRHKSGGG